METCPLTGEPLPDPGQTISHSALQQLRAATNNLNGLHHAYQQALAMHRPTEIHTRLPARSQPPLNLHLLDAASDHWDTILIWAANIMAYMNPTLRIPNNDWATIQAIYQQHTLSLATWTYAPTMCDEVTDALRHLQRAIHPAQRTSAPTELERLTLLDSLRDQWLTITNACTAVQTLTGKELKPATIRKWKQRGHITSTGNPPRYLIQDLLDQHTH